MPIKLLLVCFTENSFPNIIEDMKQGEEDKNMWELLVAYFSLSLFLLLGSVPEANIWCPPPPPVEYAKM